jgi:hypothetical protein
MLKTFDTIYQRISNAWLVFRNPHELHYTYVDGIEMGKAIAFAQVRQQFDTYDPYQFDNAHFKMGYYYAAEQAKKVMPNDENRVVD